MKSLTTMFRIALGLLALGLTTTIVKAKDEADKERKPSREMMKKYDANHDGMLDDAEKATMKADADAKAKEMKAANLAKYDVNKDGKLDDAEKAAMKADKETKKAEREAKKSRHENEQK